MSEPTTPSSLHALLSNSLILLSICPLLSLSSILALTGTSKAISALIWKTPQVFKRLDLSTCRVRHRDYKNYSDAKFISRSGNVSHRFFWYDVSNCLDRLARKTTLQRISIMILDGLPVTEQVLRMITERLNVRLLSIRGITKAWPSSVRNLLKDLINSSHPDPKLKGLYYFGSTNDPPMRHATAGSANTGIMSTPGAQLGARAPMPSEESTSHSKPVDWYDGNGEVPLSRLGEPGERHSWEVVVNACAGIIAFDVISCRRCPMTVEDKRTVPRLATISLKGCQICGSCPEGPAYVGESPESHLPLLAPLPLYSSTVKVAQIPPSEALSAPPLIARCKKCLVDRWCQNCNAWWCESCYTPPDKISNDDRSLQATSNNGSVRVHLGLCVENCLVSEMYSGVGEGGMWG